MGTQCEIDVTTQCGFQVPSGEIYSCSGRGQCVYHDDDYSCLCDSGYTGEFCELGDCPEPCDQFSTCRLPTPGSTQKICMCNYVGVYGINSTYPNLCNVDLCKTQNILTQPNVNGSSCECIDSGYTFASGCITPACPVDAASGDTCGPARVGDAVQGACRVPYDYIFFADSYARTGTTRRNHECDRNEKRCVAGACQCGLGYTQDPVTFTCKRVCDPTHTTAVVDCLGTDAPGCFVTGYPSIIASSHTYMRCVCDPAYSGSLYCDTLRCMHGGVSTADGKRCECPFPWTGSVCTDDLCVNGVANFVNNTCDCLFGWTGDRCDRTACVNGGTPDYQTLACRCPAQWGGPTCAELTCKFNSYYNQITRTCQCSPGYTGDRCDIPICGNNVLPDADGVCHCGENYMDALCLYRWCGPYGSVFPGTRTCLCRPKTGAVLDPITGNCTLPVCGPHASWNIDSQTCVCASGYFKNTSEPLQPCVHYDCGAHGTFNSYVGGCVCEPNWIGALCDTDVVAFVQPLIRTPINLPNGIIVYPTDVNTISEELLLPGAPGAIVQIVLRDPYPLPISYEEDAIRAITHYIPGYTILYEDLVDTVSDHAGLPMTNDPLNTIVYDVPSSNTTDVYSNEMSSLAYYGSAAALVGIGFVGLGIGYSIITSIMFARNTMLV